MQVLLGRTEVMKVRWRPTALVFLNVVGRGKQDLPQVAHTLRGVRLPARGGERGQQNRDEDRDDADHHQQLDQCERASHVRFTVGGTSKSRVRKLTTQLPAPACACRSSPRLNQ